MTELKEIIRSGETVVINDSKTGYEITSEVLTKAIVDQGGKETLSPDALHALIRWGTETFESGLAIFGKSLHKVLPVANVSDVRSLLGKISELEERVDSLQQKVDEQQNRSELS